MLDIIFLIAGLAASYSQFDIGDYKTYDDLSVYEERLSELNEKYGKEYEILYETTTETHQDIIDFYTSMTLKEFDDYIMSISFYPPKSRSFPDDVKENAIFSDDTHDTVTNSSTISLD